MEPEGLTAANLKGWPDLSGQTLKPTLDALQLWSQVAGKVRMMLTPWENHSWHLPLYVTAQGLGTGLITAGARGFSIDFALLSDELVIRTTDGQTRSIALAPRSIASFYAAMMSALAELGFAVRINTMPNEIADAVPFHQDVTVRAYDADMARAY